MSARVSCRRPSAALPRRHPLAFSLGLLLAPAAAIAFPTAAAAATHEVTTCADAGAGSLRDAIASAVDGDTITFALACSRITLTSGAIAIGTGADGEPITTLALVGPGRNALTVDGSYADRVFVHDAGALGALTISGLTLQHGVAVGDGGCLRAEGDLALDDVGIEQCSASQADGTTRTRGGGVFVGGDATLSTSLVGENAVNGHGGDAYGAGLFAGGSVTLISSTISQNFANSDDGAVFGGGIAIGDRAAQVQGSLAANGSSIQNNGTNSHCGACQVRGGGAWIYGSSTFEDSVIGGNSAFSDAHYGAGGGLYFASRYGGAPVTATLVGTDASSNSADENAGAIGAGGDLRFERGTISGNSANGSGGAIALFAGDLTLVDSLLTGNIAMQDGGGVFVFGYGDAGARNTTISENMALGSGGAIANTYGSVHLSNSTLTANFANAAGGGIWFRYGDYALGLDSTIVAGNTVGETADDISGPGLVVDGTHDL
ncbi:MAG TPA: hypothetical protein VGC30_00565, partial [Dokdonella sp.]